jgi:hypothetical protein
MKLFSRTLTRCLGLLLVCVLLAPSLASAKPLTPETVHSRLLKRGVGNWACVTLQNGVAFCGRVIEFNQQSFGMQLYNDPEITPVYYNDVVDLSQGITRKGFWIITGAGFAAMATIAAVSIHEMNKNKLQMPTSPTTPTPVFP